MKVFRTNTTVGDAELGRNKYPLKVLTLFEPAFKFCFYLANHGLFQYVLVKVGFMKNTFTYAQFFHRTFTVKSMVP